MPSPARKPFRFRLDFPPELPISSRAEDIVMAIQAHQVVILAGETGSGKTTQIPKMCLAAGQGVRGRIACTQPRRVAALSISRRVADELGVEWGREVGCKVRFSDQTSPQTVIKFLTDGMLLAEVQSDPQLRAYDTIILDEAHERSLNIDFLLGHLRNLRFLRPELKIIVTSATIDTQAFSAAFDGAPVIEVSGRAHPVEVIYAPLDALGSDAAADDEPDARAEALHYVDGAVEAVERIVRESIGGDILVFMPSERDIREASDLLDGKPEIRNSKSEIVPLFGRLSNAEQQRVFAPTQRRKIILATNIAETSLTIPGIRYVVDTGLARLSRYSPQARTRRLPIEPVAQSSADQRKGRAGRVAEGVCIRLYAEQDYLERPRFTQPEIQRANLADVILRLKAFGLGDIERFPFLNPPAPKAIRAGYALLEELGALEDNNPVGPAGGRAARPPGGPIEEIPQHSLTAIGRELARLPVDPTVGRMILQARNEKCLREVLAIAAGLSIQDPRERPLEKQAAADAAHRRFAHPDSDFLTLLNIWDAYHDEFETMTQGKLRRFCHDHFLSYVRMREWRDIHAQLLDVLRERDGFKMTSVEDGLIANAKSQTPNAKLAWGTPAYRAIHRSILTGLLGNIALYDEEARLYKATHDRKVALFPGSVLFARDDPKKRRPDPGQRPAPKKETKNPRWIMAAEIVETSRVFARTCARLDPQWALDLGAHLVKVSHSEPFWNVEAGRVMVKRRTRLYGLEIDVRAVSYGSVDPVAATEIFIREGLVGDTITWPFDFLAHNRRVRAKIEFILTRTRDSGYLNLDEAMYRYYSARLLPGGKPESRNSKSESRNLKSESQNQEPKTQNPEPETQNQESGTRNPELENPKSKIENMRGVSSVAELVDLVRARRATESKFLLMAPEDLRDPETLVHDTAAFPAALPLENRVLALAYAYKPGQTDDGVSLEVHVRDAAALTAAALDWAVPGYTAAKVEHYLRALPKELRRSFVPLAETAANVTRAIEQLARLRGQQATLVELLSEHLRDRFGIRFDPVVWADKPPPEHLRVRMRVVDDRGQELCASRELAEIRAALATCTREVSAVAAQEEPAMWRRARARWEKPESAEWTFGDLPARVEVGDQAGVPVYAYPGLQAGPDGPAVRLYRTPEEADTATRGGLARLIELQLSRDLGWLERDLRALRQLGTLTVPVAPLEQLQDDAFTTLRRWLCEPSRVVAVAAPVRRNSSGEGGSASEWRHPAGIGEAMGPLAGARRHGIAAAAFAAAVDTARTDLRGLVPRLVELLREILALRQELLTHAEPYVGLARDVVALVPPDFLRTTPYLQLAHFPRYLKAMKQRADRWRKDPTKDAERAQALAPFVAKAAKLSRLDRRYWLVEEYRVSVFAQELGTAETISAVKLERELAGGGRSPHENFRAGTPAVSSSNQSIPAESAHENEKRRDSAIPSYSDDQAAVTPAKKSSPAKKATPLKSLGALDALLRKS
jgi:ATP-dependent helicase HrpA